MIAFNIILFFTLPSLFFSLSLFSFPSLLSVILDSTPGLLFDDSEQRHVGNWTVGFFPDINDIVS
jgi:hypothetical protein